MKVYRVLRCVDGDLVEDSPMPSKSEFRIGNILNVLTGLSAPEGAVGSSWNFEVALSGGPKPQRITMPIEPFLTAPEYAKSLREPVCFAELQALRAYLAKEKAPTARPPSWLWLFRDGIYVTERTPRPSETEEVILQIKALHFQRDESLRRLKEQVANYEAVESNLRRPVVRPPIPDDVKLLVWTRDGGACVKCEARTDLQFDHVIPLARGGSNTAENIQLLCVICNLRKSDRIA